MHRLKFVRFSRFVYFFLSDEFWCLRKCDKQFLIIVGNDHGVHFTTYYFHTKIMLLFRFRPKEISLVYNILFICVCLTLIMMLYCVIYIGLLLLFCCYSNYFSLFVLLYMKLFYYWKNDVYAFTIVNKNELSLNHFNVKWKRNWIAQWNETYF